MPTDRVAAIARYPLVGGGAFGPTSPLGIVLWTAGFSLAATIVFRLDTCRV